jgi:hypothetical protein
LPIEVRDIVAPPGRGRGMSESQPVEDRSRGGPAVPRSTIHFGVFALMLAVTMPRLLRSYCPTSDPLDTSWAWMLGYALQHHLQWGKSMVFTYGPLGFLTHAYFYPDHMLWKLAATARLTSWFIFGLGFACILRRLTPSDGPLPRTTLPVAIGWTVGATFLHLSTQSAILGVLLMALAMAEEDGAAATTELILSGTLLALGALIKSTALIVSLFALLIYPALWRLAGGRARRSQPAFIPLFSFLASFCASWSLASQSFHNLPAYLRGTWAIASGYTPAMSVTGLEAQTALALLILSLLAGALIALNAARKTIHVAQCLLLGGVAFWAWKEGFTLQDWGYFGHPMTFFGAALLIASAGTVLVSKESSRYLTSCVYGAYAIALLCSIQGYPTLSLSYKNVLDNYGRYLALTFSRSRRMAEQSSQTLAIHRQFPLPGGALSAVGEATVNVIPWSLMMAQGYHMRLVASPIIQSYSAYTPYLDGVNARQIWEGKSADRIIYSYESFGDRYPLFDEPATLRAILTCYRMEYPGDPYAVLSHVPCGRPEMLATDQPESGAFGRWIAVPRRGSYAEIAVRATLIGELADILYKPDYVRVFFRLADGTVKGPYRFIYPVAEDGLFVRYFIGSQSEATRLFSGDASGLRRIAAIKIATDRPSPDFVRHFEVRFFDESRAQPPRPVIETDRRRSTAAT